MRTERWILVFATVVAIGLLSGCGDGSPAPASGASGAPGTADVETAAAPAFDLPLAIGDGTVSLEESTGKLRLVDFWATWCPPCIEEMPMFKDLHATYGDRGLVIVGLSADTDEEALREFLEKEGLPWENALADDDLRAAYNVVGLPQTFLIDEDGNIAKRFPPGPVPRAVLVEWIEKLLPQGEAAAGA